MLHQQTKKICKVKTPINQSIKKHDLNEDRELKKEIT